MQWQLVTTPTSGVDFGAAYDASALGLLRDQGIRRVWVDVATSGIESTVAAAYALGLEVAFFQGYWPDAFANPAAAAQRGQAAAAVVQRATGVARQPGLVIGLDWEAVPASVTPAAAAQWIDTWAEAVAAAGFLPGLYVGAQQPLDGEALWERRVYRYWAAPGPAIPAIPHRGYCVRQERLNVAYGSNPPVLVDLDTALVDGLGGTWTALAPVAGGSGSSSLASQVQQLQREMAVLRQALVQLGDSLRGLS